MTEGSGAGSTLCTCPTEVHYADCRVIQQWGEIEALRADFDGQAETIRQLRADLEAAQSNAEMWHKQHATACQTIDRNQGTIDQLNADLAQARARITELEKAIRAHAMRRRPGDSEP